jgi:hypothetical protein
MQTQHNVDPKVWGPSIWNTIHHAAISADKSKNGSDFKKFIFAIGPLLPCFTCKEDFEAYLKSSAPQESHYFEWSVKAHNYVNKKLGKTQISMDDALKIWTFDLCTDDCSKSKKGSTFVICLILALFVLILLFMMHKPT